MLYRPCQQRPSGFSAGKLIHFQLRIISLPDPFLPPDPFPLQIIYPSNDTPSERYTITDQRSKLGDDVIEAIECLKSWAREDIVYGAGSQVRQVESMLADLERQAAEMAA
jgi:hypothetical protein